MGQNTDEVMQSLTRYLRKAIEEVTTRYGGFELDVHWESVEGDPEEAFKTGIRTLEPTGELTISVRRAAPKADAG